MSVDGSSQERESPAPATDAGGAAGCGSVPLTGIFVLLLFFALDFASSVLIPIALALLIALTLAPFVRSLKRIGIPAPASAAAVVLILLGTFVGSVYGLSEPAQRWFAGLPTEMQRLEYRIRRIKKPIEELQKATEKVEEAAGIGEGKQPAVQVEERTVTRFLASATPGLAAGIGMVVVLVFYLLATGDEVLRKLVSTFPRLSEKKRAVEVVRAIQQQISRYLFVCTLINAGLGTATALALWMMDVPNAPLWGVMVALLNYAPYIGPAIGIFVLALVGLLNFDPVWQALGVPAVYLMLTLLEGQFITPSILGRHLALSPLAVILSLIGWGWLWGVPGALMAVPLLAILKVLSEHVESMSRLELFLSGGSGTGNSAE